MSRTRAATTEEGGRRAAAGNPAREGETSVGYDVNASSAEADSLVRTTSEGTGSTLVERLGVFQSFGIRGGVRIAIIVQPTPAGPA
jgi:hypothetical protein